MTNLQIFLIIGLLVILFYYAIILIIQTSNKQKYKKQIKENFLNIDNSDLTCPGVDKLQTNAIGDPTKYSDNLDCLINKLSGELNIDDNASIYTDILTKQKKMIDLIILQTLLTTDLNGSFNMSLFYLGVISKLPDEAISFIQGKTSDSSSSSSGGLW